MTIQNLRKIGVLLGGISRERDVSLRSGKAVLDALREKGLPAEPVEIYDGDMVEELQSRNLDFAFITLHGKGGEDGQIQAILEKLGIPYLGSDAEASERAFNKSTAKKIFTDSGVLTPPYAVATAADWMEKTARLRFPLFIKPTDEGSSIDVFRVAAPAELASVLEGLFGKYSEVLVEQGIAGRELTVGILGRRTLPVVEIRPHRDFYDYTAKYQSDKTEYLVPAELEEEICHAVQTMALNAHLALGLRDFSRVDIMLEGDRPYVLEANTIPGFTATSLLPKAAAATGLGFSDLCAELIRIALERVANEEEKKDKKVFTR